MIKHCIPVIERLFSLLVVFLLLSATVMWSGRFWGKDWLTAAQQPGISLVGQSSPVLPAPNVLAQLGLESTQLTPSDSAAWHIEVAGESAGYLVASAPLAPKVTGFSGATPVYVWLDNEMTIRDIVPGEHAETPDFFQRAAAKVFGQLKGLSAAEALEQEVDGATGATYSSLALTENVKAVLATYGEGAALQRQEPAIGWGRLLAMIAVVLAGILVAWRFRGNLGLRVTVLVLNVGVTGFWCGQFLSLTLLRGWLTNGIDVWLYLPTLILLGVALIMPYFGFRNHYCTWTCPFGSLQELAYRFPVPKLKLSSRAYRIMRKVRLVLLLSLLALLWMGYGLFLLDYEPFSAFLLTAAAPAVMGMAGGIVLLSLFVPQPWCRCCCPIGALLNLAEQDK